MEPQDNIEEPDDSEELDLDEDVEDEELALATDDEDEDDTAGLDELLAQRSADRRGSDETDDEEDILALATEARTALPVEPLPVKVIPIRDRKEFVCKGCHLVKARVQLADAEHELCRDCV